MEYHNQTQDNTINDTRKATRPLNNLQLRALDDIKKNKLRTFNFSDVARLQSKVYLKKLVSEIRAFEI